MLSAAESARPVPGILVVGAAVAALAVAALAYTADARLGVACLALPLGLAVAASPPAGAAILLFTLPLEDLSALSPGGMLTLTKLLGVGVVGSWLVHALLRRQPIHVPLGAWPLAGFAAWGAASSTWAVDPAATAHVAITFVQLLALYLLVVNVLDTPRAMRRALQAHVAGAVVLAVIALYLMVNGVLQRGRVAIVVEHQMIMQSNELAAALILPVAVCLASGLDRSRPRLERLALTLAGALFATTVVFTLSRGALVALALMAILVGVARRRVGTLLAALLLALPGLAMVGPELWERLSEGVTLADRGAGRLDIWQVGWEVIRSNPLVGVGLGCFPIVYFDYLSAAAGVSRKHALAVLETLQKSPHNTFLGATAELGMLGLGLVVAALVIHLRTARAAFSALYARRHPATDLMLAAAIGLTGLVVFAFSADVMHRKYLWVALGLAAAGEVRKRAPSHRAAASRHAA